MSGVGSDIQANCKKCGDVWHVVVAKVGVTIAKVQCKECKKYHRFRPVGGGPAPRVRRVAAGSKKSSKAAMTTAPEVEPDMSKPIRPYSIRETFDMRERVDHPKFGIGVVESSPGPGKINVFFPGGRKVLAHSRA